MSNTAFSFGFKNTASKKKPDTFMSTNFDTDPELVDLQRTLMNRPAAKKNPVRMKVGPPAKSKMLDLDFITFV